jgi:aminoglycoside 6'-N-acetyltransferase
MTGSRLHFRVLGRPDLGLLAQWLATPHVQVWWRENSDAASVERRYGPAVNGTDPTELFIVERNGDPVGFVQRYLLDDNPEWQRSLAESGAPTHAAGIDYFIGRETLIGRGLGPDIIDVFVEDTWERYPDISAVVASVAQDNRRSWRALEKAGFHRVWSGIVVSDDPSDAGPSHVYVRHRPHRLGPTGGA